MMWYFIFVFVLGACVGSFVNVLIDHTVAGRNWVTGRSVCDHCAKILKWYDMIPLASYIMLGGKSRCCQKTLTPKHLVVELLFGALFVWWLTIGFAFFHLANAPLSYAQPIFWLGVGVILTILALADLMWGVILMRVLWVGVAWVIGYRVILYSYGAYQLSDLWLMMLMGILSFFFLWFLRFITKGRGMGDGDPYLIFLTSMLLGYPRAIIGVLAAFVGGAVVGMILIISGMRQRSDKIAFGPFIVVGAVIALLWGEGLLSSLYGI